MTRVKKTNKSWIKSYFDQLFITKITNRSLLGLVGVTTLACNASQDDQCYGGLGVIIGSFCASQNDIVPVTEVKLTQIASSADFPLTLARDSEGNLISDTVEFTNNNNVTGTKYTLTDGDILKNPGTVFINLINSGSIDGQTIFNADEIELSTQGTTVVLTSDWYNNDVIKIKGSDQSVTLNDLQSSKLDAAIAPDNMFYPNTSYKIEDVIAPSQIISFYFNGEAILGTSTEVDLSIKDSVIGLQAGVFTNPNPETAVVDPDATVDPFLVAEDSNIEKLNLEIVDTNSVGSRIVDLNYVGLETLNLLGGTANYNFEITSPLGVSLTKINALDVPADLILDVSESTSEKSINLGSGNDILALGDSLVEAPASDSIHGGDGLDKLLITFAGAITAAPNLSSFESVDLSVNGDSILDFSHVSDLDTINILESSAGVSLTNIPYDLTKFNISGSQTGIWSFGFEDNSDSTIDLNWSNNTGASVALTSLAFNEVQSSSIIFDGANEVVLAALALDPDDTTLTSITNIGDGNLEISTAANIDTLDAVTAISLTTTEGGDILLGSVTSNFGISDAQKLSTINLVSSETGQIELGRIGGTTVVEDLQLISITSSGANINVGDIVASKSGIFSVAISSSAVVSVGNMNFEHSGTSFTATGSGTLGQIAFTNEAYSTINLSDLITNTNVNFSNADNGVTILSGSGNDTITLGLGTDIVTGNNGEDIFVIGNNASGLTLETADIITDFQSNTDKLKLGLLGDETSNTGNYVESSLSVTNYAEALIAANSALTTLNATSAASELYAFQYDSNSGYLFVDNDSDGAADNLIVLSGIESSIISASDIIA